MRIELKSGCFSMECESCKNIIQINLLWVFIAFGWLEMDLFA